MKLFYREFGNGKPIIILHGLFGSSDNWMTIGKSIAYNNNCKVIIPDQRNHGKSPHHPAMDYFALTKDLHELYQSLNIEEASIIGHSMGGKVAMYFALENSNMIEKLIVVDISPVNYNTYDYANFFEIIDKIDFSKFKTRKDVEQHLMSFCPDERFVKFMLKNVHNLSRGSLGWKINVAAIKNHLEDILKFKAVARSFQKQTLFIKATDSDYITSEHNEAIKRYFPSSEMVVLENTTHWLHAEKPTEIINTISKFLF